MNKLQAEGRSFKMAFDHIAVPVDFFLSDEDIYQFQMLHPDVYFFCSSSCVLKLRKRQISNFLGIKRGLGLKYGTSCIMSELMLHPSFTETFLSLKNITV